MTALEHSKELSRLKGAITRANNALVKAVIFNDKILQKQKVGQLELQLLNHKLNYYSLTTK